MTRDLIKLNRCYFLSMLHRQQGQFEFYKMQEMQEKHLGFVDSGYKFVFFDRIQRGCIGRYGYGQFRFNSKEHYEVFKKLYPQLALRLNPNPDKVDVQSKDGWTQELAELEGAFKNTDGVVELIGEIKLRAKEFDNENQKELIMIKAKIARAINQYIQSNIHDAQLLLNKSWFRVPFFLSSSSRRSGVVRAMEFDSKIAEMKSTDEVSTAVTQLFKSHQEGNWNSRSLKTMLFHELKEVDSMPRVKMNVKKHYEQYKIIQFFKAVFLYSVIPTRSAFSCLCSLFKNRNKKFPPDPISSHQIDSDKINIKILRNVDEKRAMLLPFGMSYNNVELISGKHSDSVQFFNESSTGKNGTHISNAQRNGFELQMRKYLMHLQQCQLVPTDKKKTYIFLPRKNENVSCDDASRALLVSMDGNSQSASENDCNLEKEISTPTKEGDEKYDIITDFIQKASELAIRLRVPELAKFISEDDGFRDRLCQLMRQAGEQHVKVICDSILIQFIGQAITSGSKDPCASDRKTWFSAMMESKFQENNGPLMIHCLGTSYRGDQVPGASLVQLSSQLPGVNIILNGPDAFNRGFQTSNGFFSTEQNSKIADLILEYNHKSTNPRDVALDGHSRGAVTALVLAAEKRKHSAPHYQHIKSVFAFDPVAGNLSKKKHDKGLLNLSQSSCSKSNKVTGRRSAWRSNIVREIAKIFTSTKKSAKRNLPRRPIIKH